MAANTQKLRQHTNTARVLNLFAENMGQTVSHEDLFNAMWPDGWRPDDPTNNLKVTINRLRGRLKKGVSIETVRGEGYALVKDDEQ